MEDYKKEFLDTVEEQIAYKPLRSVLIQELEEHIFDRMEEYEARGISQKEAGELAVRDMGDPVVIGTELNTVHRIQKAPALAAMTLLLISLGFVGAVWMRWSPEQYSNGCLYYIPGLFLLILMAWKGYPFMIRHSKQLLILAGSLFLAGEVLCTQKMLPFWKMGYFLGYFRYFGILLFAPFLILLAYRLRRYQSKAILTAFVLCGACILFPGFYRGYNRDLSACAVLAVSVTGTLLMMNHRDIFTGSTLSRKGMYGILFTGLAAVGSLFVFTGSRREALYQFINPDASIRSTWDDTYNSALIRRLLSETPLIGGIDLTSQELMDYGTGAWYFEKRDPRQIGIYAIYHTEEEEQRFEAAVAKARDEGGLPRYIHFDESNVTLWDILPQHYHNNYQIALCILLFGWLAGAVLLAAVAGFYLMLFACIRTIRGRLAFSLSCCCGICLLMEGILYILGNFGYQYASFTSLPMISEGRISIVVNMLLLGFIFSAYRYDRVEAEPIQGSVPS